MARHPTARPARARAEPQTLSGLEILRWAHGGEGVAIPTSGPLEGRIVFVPEAVPGDLVDVAILESKDRWARGRIARFVRPSPERVPVPCVVQGRCGGCPWMAGSAAAQADSRQKILVGELTKRLGFVGPAPTMLESPTRLGYRQRLKLTFERHGDGRVTLGFLGKKSHALVDIARCEVANERINAVLPELRERIAALPAGSQGRVTLLAGAEGVAGVIEPRGAEALAFGPATVRLTLGDYAQSLSARAFAQANGAVTGQMLATLATWASRVRGDSNDPDPWAVELFAGAGTLTMALWRSGWRVVAYEVAEAARPGFEATRAAAAVTPERGQWHAADLAVGMPWPAPPAPTLVVLDPPRTGAAEVMPWVRASGARAVIYVSCDLATGLRDMALLSGDGRYAIREVVGLDMFPHAGHQEVMFLADRVGDPRA